MIENVQKEFSIERILDASREDVWKAWTDPALLTQWWGPNGVTTPICEFEAKPNGVVHIVMEAGAEMGDFKGTQWPMTGTIKEITEPSKLVYTSINMIDETGKILFETLNTVTFEEVTSGKTKMTFHVEVTQFVETPASQFAVGGMRAGWTQALDKLNTFLTN